jgi:hypothetical protein
MAADCVAAAKIQATVAAIPDFLSFQNADHQTGDLTRQLENNHLPGSMRETSQQSHLINTRPNPLASCHQRAREHA